MNPDKQKTIEKIIKLQKQLREETDPEKREEIWRQMKASQMHSINAMYGIRGLYDKDSDTVIPLSFDMIGKKNNRKYDIPNEVLIESFKKRKKYKRVIDIDDPNLEEIVNGLDGIKVVKPVMYALFKEIVLHIIQDNNVKTYTESIIEYGSSDREAIVNRFKNMKEDNISYIIYDIKRSLSTLINRSIESLELELIGDDETSLSYLVKSKDKDVIGSVFLNIRPVVEADIKHKSKP